MKRIFFSQTFIFVTEIFFVDDDSLTLKRLTEKLIRERNPQSEQLNTFCNLQLSAMKRGIN